MSVNKDLSLVFFRLIDGQEYDGVVKAKEQAQQQYTEAVFCGQSAVLVRYMDQFITRFYTDEFISFICRRILCVLWFTFLQNSGYFHIFWSLISF